MSLTVAYSLEIKDYVDAELAYELFWTGTIKDKKAFKCPDPNCDSDVTCANMDIATDNLKQSPHFRAFNHSQECTILIQQNNSISGKGAKLNTVRDNTDELLLTRPLYNVKEKSNVIEEDTTSYRKRITTSIIAGTYTPRYFTIRSLVAKFIHLRQIKGAEEHFVKIGKDKISYKDLFIGIYNQSFENLPDEKRIYWGLAYYNRNENIHTYNLRFEKEFSLESQNIRPSIFISDIQLQQYHSSILEKRIKFISQMPKPKAFVFVYGTPVLNQKDDKVYINFKVDNLDLIDIKDLSFFDELRK